VQRFILDIDPATGIVCGFKLPQTVMLRDESGNLLGGIAPSPVSQLGRAFEPDGFVIHSTKGYFFVNMPASDLCGFVAAKPRLS
jgi:hypothetical protein